MSQKIDFAGLKASLLATADTIVPSWLPSGVREGKEWCVGNLQGEAGKSLKVNLSTGIWSDFSTNESGADLIDLYAAMHKISVGDAAKRLLNISQDKPSARKRSEPKVVALPAPEGQDAPRLKLDGYDFERQHVYRNKSGEKISIVQIYRAPDGLKSVRPWLWDGKKFVSKHYPKPRPLYNLPDIARYPEKPVVIVEGEKCADVARSIFGHYVATTWSGGAQSAKHADWSVIGGRSVLIIPDADDAGVDAALEVAKILDDLGCSIKITDVSDRADGWDIADAVNSGLPPQDLYAYIRQKTMPLADFKKKNELSQKICITDEIVAPNLDGLDNDPLGDGVPASGPSEHELERNRNFRFLGINGMKFYFYKYKTSQIVSFTSEELGKEGPLVMLADKEFWDVEMGCQGKYAFMRDTLVRISEKYRFDPRLVRRVGIWKDESGNVIHLGDKIMTEFGVVPLSSFKSKHIYEYSEKAIRIPGYRAPLKKEESSKLIKFCSGSYWSDPIAPRILAGWIFSSLICASIRWRSHIYIVGPAGSGKTWLMSNIVSKALGDFACHAISSSTEASIRQGLANNMIPVLFDEAEATDINAGARRDAIFELARQASSSDDSMAITKGSPGGTTKDYFVRSPFLFSSINANMNYADESRTTFLYLRPIPRTADVRPKFRELDREAKETLTPSYHAGLLARALKHMPDMEKCFEIFADAAYETIAQDSRHAEQMAFMIVGLWFLEKDHIPTQQEAIHYVAAMSYMSQQRKNTITTEERLIASISQCVVKYRLSSGTIEERIIGELVKASYLEGGGTAEQVLRRYGMLVKGNRLFICNNAENLKKSLRNTPFFGGWEKVIINVMGAKDEGIVTFAPGVIGPTVSIPLKSLIGEVNAEKHEESLSDVL